MKQRKNPPPVNDNETLCVVFADTYCPKCGALVKLSGEGHPGAVIRITGRCPQGDLVYFNHPGT